METPATEREWKFVMSWGHQPTNQHLFWVFFFFFWWKKEEVMMMMMR